MFFLKKLSFYLLDFLKGNVGRGSPLKNEQHHSLYTNLHISISSFTWEPQLNFAAWFENHFNNIYFGLHMFTGDVIIS